MNKTIYPILLALVLLVPGSILIQTQAQTALATTDFKVFASGIDNITHELQLKATEDDGQINTVSDFVLSPENVVQVRQGMNLVVFTSTNEPERIEKVKVTDSVEITTDLLRLQRGQYSLSSLSVGVYVLNVITDLPHSADKGAYETILVILAPNQSPISITEITKVIQKTDVNVKIEIDNDNDNDKGDGNKTKPPSTNNTKPKPTPTPPKANSTEPIICKLDSGFVDGKCKPIIPPRCYDEKPQDGQVCRDEGDFDDCEEGFVDKGFGCRPIEGTVEETEEEVEVEEQPELVIDENDTPPVEEEEETEESNTEVDEEEEENTDDGSNTNEEEE